jgi:hypothetical protein
MTACAALEAEFGVENFEEVFPLLGEVTRKDGEAADENGKFDFKPKHAALRRFWATVLKANGHDAAKFESELVNPFTAAGAAFDLLNATREAWFAGDAAASGDGAPLAGARAGGTG